MPPMHHHGPHGHEPEHAANPLQTLRELFAFLQGKRLQIGFLTLPITLSVLSGLVWPRMIGKIIDTIKESIDAEGGAPPYRAIALAVAVGLGAFLLNQACSLILGYTTNRLSNETVRDMRARLFSHVQHLPVGAFSHTTHGEFMSRLTNDADMVSSTLGNGITRFFETLLVLVSTLAYMLYLSPILTAVTCITLPISIFLGRGIARISRKLFRERQKRLGDINGLVEEMVTGQHIVQAFSYEPTAEARFHTIAEDLRVIGIRADTLGGFMGPCMNLVSNLTFILVAAAGGHLAANGTLSVGIIVAFLLYSRQFERPVNELAHQFNDIQSAIAGAERIFKVLHTPPEEDTGTTPFQPNSVQGTIEFRDVSFAYNPDTPVISHFSATFHPGEKIALVGETGSGKTTLVSLLSRFFETASGSILIDGIDIRDIPKKDLRSCMAIVLQDTHLFSGTIRENIVFGAPNASEEDIRAAARLANADLFIDRLPKAYDTPINQADTALSQGQCQLLSIARAALSNPAILILDEATSSVDTRTEKHIQEAMTRLMQGRTSLIIAHRLSTIRDADRIFVLENGSLAECGTHQQLLAQNGPYARMVHAMDPDAA